MNTLERARAYLAKIEPAVSGQGGHNQTFRAAAALASFGLGEADCFALLSEWNQRCQPPWPEPPLLHKVRDALRVVKPNRGPDRAPSQPVRVRPSVRMVSFNRPVFESIASTAPKLSFQGWRQWLWERSPVRPECMSPGSFLARLYRPGEHILVFANMREKFPAAHVEIKEAGTDQLDRVRRAGPEGVWFLSQPVDGNWHRTAEGLSCRCAAAVTSFRFAVLESDSVPPADWLRLLVALPLRLAAVYTSGGRSIHALVRVDAKTKEDWDDKVVPFKPMLKALGADPGALTAVRLTRLPGCWRGPNYQRGLYINPDPAERPLTEAPVRESRKAFLERMRVVHPRWSADRRAEQ